MTKHLPIDHADFAGRGLMLRPGGWRRSPGLVIDQDEVAGRWRHFVLRDNQGNERTAKLVGIGLDPTPAVEIDGETFHPARPLRWFEAAMASMPMAVGLFAGWVGAALGTMASYAGFRVLRSAMPTYVKGASVLGLALSVLLAAVVGPLALHDATGLSPDSFEESFARSYVSSCVPTCTSGNDNLTEVCGSICTCSLNRIVEGRTRLQQLWLGIKFQVPALLTDADQSMATSVATRCLDEARRVVAARENQ